MAAVTPAPAAGRESDADVIGRSRRDPEAFAALFDRYDPARPDARPWPYGIASNLIARHGRAEVRQYRALARACGRRPRRAAARRLGDARAAHPAARDAARAALLDRARPTASVAPLRRRGGRRLALRLGVVSAAAAAAVAGITVVQTGGSDGHGHQRPILPGIPAGPVANAAEALDRAALAAERRPFTAPRPDQWIYTETHLTTSVHAAGVTTGGPYRTVVERHWRRGDGTEEAALGPDGRMSHQIMSVVQPRTG
ncbi:hypothetical protein [Actinomadura parmotrematis]|uniref:Uncharacterized protein n=1 Tax=Actinomadura parmotrematis TaxID=2864039 RepID=A0ABS7FVB1_9ACTN|nr:hypothetical protein [Actinomadura parmotrematis]MBW8484372.1 hypothetical protein [Actinomadura parmotrematis]